PRTRHLPSYARPLHDALPICCTLLIEIDDAAERAVKLRAWLDLPEHLYLVLPDGRRVRPRVDERQRDGERISSVHYLTFDVGGQDRKSTRLNSSHQIISYAVF